MNSFVLTAKIVRNPQLRYTQQSQLAVTEMMVQFDSGFANNSKFSTLKVVGWGNIATDINDKYHEGDEVILSGRLKMDTFDRPEGFKEKKAELIVSHIEPLNSSGSNPSSDNVVKMESYKSSEIEATNSDEPDDQIIDSPDNNDQNIDDIPF